MAALDVSNVVTISVATPQAGLAGYQVNNLLYCTKETPLSTSPLYSASAPVYAAYRSATAVAADWGTSSEVYAAASFIFAQSPNILSGGGQLIVYHMATSPADTLASAITTMAGQVFFGGVVYGGYAPSDAELINAAAYCASARKLLFASQYQTTALTSGHVFNNTSATFTATTISTSNADNSFNDSGAGLPVFDVGAVVTLAGFSGSSAANNGTYAVVTSTSSKLVVSGTLVTQTAGAAYTVTSLTLGSNPYCRKLLYTVSATEARKFACAYASRLLSCDFAGSNTTSTPHLKTLSAVSADSGITQTVLNSCATLGVDVYINLAGLPKVFAANGTGSLFADQIYNQIWLINALTVAGFNALATTNTKLPQTEEGIGVLKGAYLQVIEQAVANGYIAPGTWTGSDRFGNPEDFLRSISSYGYYIYSTPLSQQSQVDRVDRKAPLIQIALKEAGAVHSSSVTVFVEA